MIAIGALLVLGGGVLWYLVGGTRSPGPQTFLGNLPIIGGRAPLAGQSGGGTPPPATPLGAGPEAQLQKIVDRDVLAPALGVDGKSLYFIDRAGGHIMQSNLDGANATAIANLTILGVFDGSWSPLKNRVAISYHERGTVKRFVESAATGTPSYFLPANTTAVSWSPDGRSIAYLARQGETTNLVIADQANRGGRTTYTSPVPDLALTWVSPSIVLLVSRPSGLAPSLVIQVDPNTRRADPILPGVRGTVVLPAPNGSGFLFSQSSDRGEAMPLAFYRFTDRRVTALDATTIAEKCAFTADAKRVVCGAPTGEMRTPSPDEWYRGETTSADAFLSIDLETGRAAPIAADEAAVDATSPVVSSNGVYFFFVDRKTGTLWRLTL